MDRNQMQYAFLKLTLGVLVGTTWLFVGFLFESRPERSSSSPVEKALTSLVRLPASLPAELHENVFNTAARPMEPIRMDVVELSCWDQGDGPVKNVSSRWIRLTGRPCQAGVMDADRVTVRNLANGYQATIFSSRGQGLTTDFIPLQKGHNEILIRFEQGAGVALESQFTFQRQ